MLWFNKNIIYWGFPFGSNWHLEFICFICFFVGWLYPTPFLKWFKTGKQEWHLRGALSGLWLSVLLPVTWIDKRATPVMWVWSVPISAWAVWGFLRDFHRFGASAVSKATFCLGWFYHEVTDEEAVARWKGGNENIRLKCQRQCQNERGVIDSLVWIPIEFSPDISEVRPENTK